MNKNLDNLKKNVEQANQKNDQYATEITKRIESTEDIPTCKISNGLIDYSLKCIKGYHKGKFLYLNMTPHGEVFGSDPENPDLTMYVENASLDKKHCQINYKNGIYNLRDLSSSTGTWIKQSNFDPIMVKPSTVIQMGTDFFTFQFGEQIKDPLEEWLKKYSLSHQASRIKETDYKTLESLSQMTVNDMSKLKMQQDESSQLYYAINDMELDITGDHIKTKLIVNNTSKNIEFNIGWDGACLGNSEGMDIRINLMTSNNTFIQNKSEAYIKYQYGRYWVANSRETPILDFYKKLIEDEEHELRSDDIIKIGNVEFQVQRFNIGVSEDKGTKRNMEDKCAIFQDANVSDLLDVSIFAVFDGHGGTDSVRFVYENLIETFRLKLLNNPISFDYSENFYEEMSKMLNISIIETDNEFYNKFFNNLYEDSGTTAVIVVIAGDRIICANVGDSRAILSRDGKPLVLSRDFKPYHTDEKKRIENAGGTVINKRVNGNNAISRAFGNFKFKSISRSNIMERANGNGEDIIAVKPDIRETQIDWLKDEFIIIGCDGLFDLITNAEIIDFIRDKLSSNDISEQDVQKAADDLIAHVKKDSVNKIKSCDNLTACIIALTRGVEPRNDNSAIDIQKQGDDEVIFGKEEVENKINQMHDISKFICIIKNR